MSRRPVANTQPITKLFTCTPSTKIGACRKKTHEEFSFTFLSFLHILIFTVLREIGAFCTCWRTTWTQLSSGSLSLSLTPRSDWSNYGLHITFQTAANMLHRIACCIALMLLLFASIKWPIDHHLKRSLTKNSILNALRPPHIKIHTNGQLDLLNSCLRMRQSFQRQEKYLNLVLKMVEKSMIDAEKRNSETDALLRRQIIAKIWAFIYLSNTS